MEPDPSLGDPARTRKSMQRPTTSQESNKLIVRLAKKRHIYWKNLADTVETMHAMVSMHDGDALPIFALHCTMAS